VISLAERFVGLVSIAARSADGARSRRREGRADAGDRRVPTPVIVA
jgi:hypothetical protein